MGGRAGAAGRGTGPKTRFASSRHDSEISNGKLRSCGRSPSRIAAAGTFSDGSMKERSPGSRQGWHRRRLLPWPIAATTTARSTRSPVPTSRWSKPCEQENLRLRAAARNGGANCRREFRAPCARGWAKIQNERDELRRQLAANPRRTKAGAARVRGNRCRAADQALAGLSGSARGTAARRKARTSREALESELRIRALRQHLLEIHEREETERRERSLTHRLSRLWSRTSPR